MIIVVHDANILIDLYETDLLTSFFLMGFTSHSTNLALYEIEQQICPHVQNGQIQQHTLTPEQLEQIVKIQAALGRGLSFPDCSVLWLAQKLGNDARLLTGDNKLRQCAKESGVMVHGILWILDQLVEKKIVSATEMAGKLEKLLVLGSRLPKEECQKRINAWKKGKQASQ